jgi:hypothetical protein
MLMDVGITSFNLYSLEAVMKARQMRAFPLVACTKKNRINNHHGNSVAS